MTPFDRIRIRINRGPFSKVILNAGWLSAARLAGNLCNFLLFVVLSRRFGPDGIGKYAYGMAVGLLVYIVFNMGVDEYGIREYSRRTREDRERFFGRLVTIQFLALVPILAGFLLFLAWTDPGRENAATLVILTAYFIFTSISDTFFIPAYSQQAMGLAAVSEFTCRVGAVAVSIWLVWGQGASLPVALLPLPVFGALQATISYRSAIRRNGRIRFAMEREDMVQMCRVAWPFSASNLVYYAYSRFNLILLTAMLGDVATGYFFSGLKFLEIGALPLNLVGVAAYPVLSRNFEESHGDFHSAAEKLMRLNLIVGGLLFWALFFFVPLALAPLLGPRFLAATPVVKGLAILALPLAIEATTIRTFFAMNLQARMVKVQAAVAVLSVAISLTLIPYFGVNGAIASSVFARFFGLVVYFLAIRRERVFRSIRNPMGAFAAIFLSAACISGFLLWKSRLEWLPAAAFLATFLVAVFGTGFLPILHVGPRKEAVIP